MPVPRSILSKDDVTDLDLAVVAGAWPPDISGHFVVSTSDQRTHPVHAFFGDGIMARLALRPGTDGAAVAGGPGASGGSPPRIGNDRFAWRPRVVDTPSVRLRRKRPDLFT